MPQLPNFQFFNIGFVLTHYETTSYSTPGVSYLGNKVVYSILLEDSNQIGVYHTLGIRWYTA